MPVPLTQAQSQMRNFKDSANSTRNGYNEQIANITAFGEVGDPYGTINAAQRLVVNQTSTPSTYITQLLTACFRLFNDTTGGNSNQLNSILALLRQYMGDNSLEIKSRGTVYNAAIDGGSNVGDQVLLFTSVDEYNQKVESCTIENLHFRCTGSAGALGSVGQETYQITSEGTAWGSSRGVLSIYDGPGRGIAANQSMQAYEAGINAGGIKNQSFDLPFTGTGTDKIRNWTIVSGEGNIARDTSVYARNRGTTNQASLKFTGNAKIRYDFRQQQTPLSQILPYIAGIRYIASNASSGDIDIRIGSATGVYTVGVNSGANSTSWVNLLCDPDTTNAWANVFNTDGQPFFEIEVSNYQSSQTIWIDDVLFQTANPVGNRLMYIASGLTVAVDGDVHDQETELTWGTGSVALTGGASGSVDTITVGGVEILGGAQAFDTSLAVTAQNCVDAINARRTNPAYWAELTSTSTITIHPLVPAEGTITVASTVTTITKTDTDITGGAFGEIQDGIVRHTTTYLPHASSATSGWGDT